MNAAPPRDQEALMRQALAEIQGLRAQLLESRKASSEPIAIVGMACRFPGGNTPEDFFDFLLKGGDGVSEIPKDRWDIDAMYDADP